MSDELDPIARRATAVADFYSATGYSNALGAAAIAFAALCPDAAEREAILARQQAKGVAKYGTTLSEAKHTPEEWHAHACEEAADLLVYLIAEEEARKAKEAAR